VACPGDFCCSVEQADLNPFYYFMINIHKKIKRSKYNLFILSKLNAKLCENFYIEKNIYLNVLLRIQ